MSIFNWKNGSNIIIPRLRRSSYLCTSAIIPQKTVGLTNGINCVVTKFFVRLG